MSLVGKNILIEIEHYIVCMHARTESHLWEYSYGSHKFL